jgi:hypothetical protein
MSETTNTWHPGVESDLRAEVARLTQEVADWVEYHDMVVDGTAKAEVARLRAALVEIKTSKFCNYENTSPDSYGTGVTDGHRYCSNIAAKALEG